MEANQNVFQTGKDAQIIIAIAHIKQYPTIERYVLHLDCLGCCMEDRSSLINDWYRLKAICEVALKNGYQM